MKDMVPYMGVREALRKKMTSGESTTAQEGEVVDTFGFDSVTFAVIGKWSADEAGKKVLFEMSHGDDLEHLEKCDPKYINALQGELTFAAPTAKVGYIGGRRYVKLAAKMSEALSSQNIDLVAQAIMLRPTIAPTA